jgi:lambda family phage minor tail protein L
MSINTSQQAATKKIFTERSKLNPTNLISFYELDLREIAQAKNDLNLYNLSYSASIPNPYQGLVNLDDNGILRFHNLDINLESYSTQLLNGQLVGQLIWKGKRYLPFPIMVEGYETATKGTLPKPKITFSNQNNISQYDYFFRTIKNSIKSIGDIIGLKVIRRRTFLRYLDAINFKSSGGIINDDNLAIDPDSLAELPSDIFYIDRKLRESKNLIEYEMSSALDLENIKLPLRTIYSESCSFDYRGSGCEYGNNVYNSQNPANGYPVATDKDEIISTLLGVAISAGSPTEWNSSNPGTYNKGQFCFININGIKYYFVAKINGLNSAIYPPTDKNYWYQDLCTKRLSGCRKRYTSSHADGIPFGGFPSTVKSV